MESKQATLYRKNPNTGRMERKIAEIGDRSVFAGDWGLETSPQISEANRLQVLRERQLPSFAAPSTRIEGQREITPSLGVPEFRGAAPQQSFQRAVMDLLKQSQKDSIDEDLLARRNALIKARFDKQAEITPEELRILSPGQQAGLRSMDVSGVETELGAAEAALQGRERARNEAREGIQNIVSMMQKTGQEKPEIREVGSDLLSIASSGEVKVIYSAPENIKKSNLSIHYETDAKGNVNQILTNPTTGETKINNLGSLGKGFKTVLTKITSIPKKIIKDEPEIFSFADKINKGELKLSNIPEKIRGKVSLKADELKKIDEISNLIYQAYKSGDDIATIKNDLKRIGISDNIYQSSFKKIQPKLIKEINQSSEKGFFGRLFGY